MPAIPENVRVCCPHFNQEIEKLFVSVATKRPEGWRHSTVTRTEGSAHLSSEKKPSSFSLAGFFLICSRQKRKESAAFRKLAFQENQRGAYLRAWAFQLFDDDSATVSGLRYFGKIADSPEFF